MRIILSLIFLILIANVYAVPTLKPCMNDLYGIIDSYDTARINGVCEELEKETSVQTAILVDNVSDIDKYAIEVFDKNKIGEKGKDNGVLILVDPSDNDWIILVGYGLEGVLNDAKLADIGRTYLEPSINSGDYGEGIYYTMGIIGTTIYDSGEFSKEKNFWKDNWPIILAIIIFIFVLIISRGRISFFPSFGRGFGGGRTGGGRGKR